MSGVSVAIGEKIVIVCTNRAGVLRYSFGLRSIKNYFYNSKNIRNALHTSSFAML
jgi:hypothetical protein